MSQIGTLQQLSRSVGVMVMQCRFMFVLLALFIFSTFAAYASLSLFSNALESRVATGFSAGIFLEAGIYPDKAALKKAMAIPGVASVEVIEPSSAPRIITRHIGRPLPLLAKGVSVDRFPYTIVVRLEQQHLLKAEEIIGLVAKEVNGIQEVRYPIEGLKNALNLLERLQSAQRQLGVMLLFVLFGGCLSIVMLSVTPQPVSRWQYSLAGLLAGTVSAALMLLSVQLASTTTGWEFSLGGQLYCWMVLAGLASGSCADITALLKRRGGSKQGASRQDIPTVMEALP